MNGHGQVRVKDGRVDGGEGRKITLRWEITVIACGSLSSPSEVPSVVDDWFYE